MSIYGYARVSTDDQTLPAQGPALIAAGGTKIYAEKISGVITDRKALAKAIKALQPGRTLFVTRLVAWRARRGTYSTSSTPLPRRALPSSRWPTLGPTPQRHSKLMPMLTVLGGLAECTKSVISK
jgi:hypothetical protein